jgi:hypothetical protein
LLWAIDHQAGAVVGSVSLTVVSLSVGVSPLMVPGP